MNKKPENRDARIPVHVTPDEKKLIEAAAEAEGLPTGTYMRVKALAAARAADVEKE